MENSNSNQTTVSSTAPWPLIVVIVLVIVGIIFAWQYTGNKPDNVVVKPVEVKKIEPIEPVVEVVRTEPELVETEVVELKPETEVVVVEKIENPLPMLDESDEWLKSKLPTLTWRKELLKLVIDDDMIRRFVVFTDNFSQGVVAYEHSPFVLPKSKFSPDTDNVSFENNQNVWQWNEQSTRRFSLYVDLLRSFDSESLVQWYMEVKPLVDQAYTELGYSDDFTDTLQDAITRVLDMELPKSSMAVVRPSVMYQYQDPALEGLADTDKLLLRLGKENLLVIKSVLLELNEKLAQQNNGVN